MLKSKFHYVLLALLISVLALNPAISANAQDGFTCPPGLDEANCALLTEANANQAKVTSFSMDYSLTLKTQGVPGGDANLDVKGSGPIDVSGLAGLAAMGSMMTGAQPDMAALAEVVKALKMSQVIDASVDATGTSMKGTFEFRIVDGVLYFQGDMATQGKWMKVDLTQALTLAGSQMGALTGQMGGANAANTAAFTQLMNDPELMKLFSDTSKFVTTEVSDGPEVDGVKTVKITQNVNLKAIVEAFTADEAKPLWKAILQAQSAEMTDEEFEKQFAQIKGLLPILDKTLEATKISSSVLVDPAAKQYRGFMFNISTTVDEALAGMTGVGATGPINVDFNFEVTLSKLNEEVVVEPVADAVDAMAGAQ